MEAWDALVRRRQRRRDFRQRRRNGQLSQEDTFYPPQRLDPWPFVAVGAAIVAAVAAGVVSWNSGRADPIEPTSTTVTIPAAAGLTSRDLSACLSFKTASAEGRGLLRASLGPGGDALVASGAVTEKMVSSYRTTADALAESFDDDQLSDLVETFYDDLTELAESTDAASFAEERAAWVAAHPDAVATIQRFGRSFDRRCERGGVLVGVADQ